MLTEAVRLMDAECYSIRGEYLTPEMILSSIPFGFDSVLVAGGRNVGTGNEVPYFFALFRQATRDYYLVYYGIKDRPESRGAASRINHVGLLTALWRASYESVRAEFKFSVEDEEPINAILKEWDAFGNLDDRFRHIYHPRTETDSFLN